MSEFTRISRHQMFMEVAQVVSKRATCMRLNVGAVVVHDRRIVSIGYNGSPPGFPHCGGEHCPGRHHCTLTVHAEMNALNYIVDQDLTDLDLYVTHSPCPTCYDSILSGGRVGHIFFGEAYRKTEHMENSLFEPHLEIYRVLPSGLVVEWSSGRILDVES